MNKQDELEERLDSMQSELLRLMDVIIDLLGREVIDGKDVFSLLIDIRSGLYFKRSNIEQKHEENK